jgi:hypothetical protein
MRPLNSLTQIPLTTNTSDIDSQAAGAEIRSRSILRLTATPFWRAWRWWLPLALIALVLVLYFVDPFIGDWDGMDYTMLSLVGYPSSMALGRSLFIFTNHGLFVIARALFGLEPESAYLLF